MGRVTVAGGKPAMEAPSAGILVSDLAVGSTVKLMEGGAAVDYLVVNQGKPGGSSLYDSSCDGTWLLRKDCYVKRAWDSSTNEYASSDIHAYLNGTFFGTLGSAERGAIKQVKIPYGVGNGTSVKSGSNGLSAKVFLLGGYEVGFTRTMTDTGSYTATAQPKDGSVLSYFSSAYDHGNNQSIRMAYMNGSAQYWWTRSPWAVSGNNISVIVVGSNGFYYSSGCTTNNAIRPALVLPGTAVFDEETMLLKGVK